MSGFVKPGEVLAIMGPSGAGKTSLLNILSQRVKASGGEILANGQHVGKAFKSISAFVQQDDVLLGNLTVRETLRYTAMLRLGNVSMKERMKRVDSLIQELGLSRVADTLPTTGLDAKTSLSVINTINKLAQNGRTVVLTIHQPRSDIFQSFDRLLLLARGKIAYFGNAKSVIPYFLKLGYDCPEAFNPADFFMDLVTENPALVEEGKTTKVEQNQRIETILSNYSENFEELASAKRDGVNMEHLTRKNKYTSGWFSQFFVVLMRSFLNTIRNKAVTMARLFQQVSTAFLLGLIYLRLKNDQTGVQDRLGVLFFSVSNMFFGSLSSSLNVLLGDKPVFNRERGAKLYRVSSWYVAKVIADIPSVLFFPLLFGCILYFWIGLNGSIDRFLMFLLIQAILGLTGQGLGIAIASISPNASVAFSIMPVISTILMLFGGFYLNLDNVPVYFVWIYW
ncbi:predicted protein [Naegleria gruberi]|uniref:Predicted protein n=1 Tax=Naegleria gruberi TaxID=5762 RepID=D2VX64_NAEGR|nr:uncharacterized protein NAEGRDRAFT_73634 [Naegleria gruberi]EFC38572.1 predicted protein [Naegleria gruberi]|eukprot:XP_002671316.1 predicted protein [Naegleria gruberi strain NEG-M]